MHGPDAAQGWAVDVSDGDEIHRLIAELVEVFGGVDILVNNAGISRPAGAVSDEAEFEEVWAATLAVNLTAQARMARATLPFLQAAVGFAVAGVVGCLVIPIPSGLGVREASLGLLVGGDPGAKLVAAVLFRGVAIVTELIMFGWVRLRARRAARTG